MTSPMFQQAYLVNDIDAAITHWHTLLLQPGDSPFLIRDKAQEKGT